MPEVLIFLVLGILILLMLSERVAIDLAAIIGILLLVLLGLLTPQQALSGFSAPPVIIMACMFVLGAALLETGVADGLAQLLGRVVGTSEVLTVLVVMLVTAAISAVMFNLPTAAFMFPVVLQLSQRTSISPSKLLLPMSIASILGGMLTILGTQPNLLASDALVARGYTGFEFADFLPIGLCTLFLGVVFVLFVWRRLLPKTAPRTQDGFALDLRALYRLEERIVYLRVPTNSPVSGLSLGEVDFGRASGARVMGILRAGGLRLNPGASDKIVAGDILVVGGRRAEIEHLQRYQGVTIQPFSLEPGSPARLPGAEGLRGLSLDITGDLIGSTPDQLLEGLAAVSVELEREGKYIFREVRKLEMQAGDVLHLLGTDAALKQVLVRTGQASHAFAVPSSELFHEHLFVLRLGPESALAGLTIATSRLDEIFGARVVGIERKGALTLRAKKDTVLEQEMGLLLIGEPDRMQRMSGLSGLVEVPGMPEYQLEDPEVMLLEVVLPPRSTLLGSSVREIGFRQRYGVQVLAIWRDGEPRRGGITNMPLRLGDALLLQLDRSKASSLARDPDFVVLGRSSMVTRRHLKASWNFLGFPLLVVLTLFSILPMEIAALLCVALVVLSGAIKIEEAYHAIEWRLVILVACLLPVGIVLEQGGLAATIAQRVIELAGGGGPYLVALLLLILSSALSQFLDGSLAVVLTAPLAIQAAEKLGIAPHALVMASALGASLVFMFPFSHKANLLVMNTGGYKSRHFMLGGSILTLLLMVVILLGLRVFWGL